MNSSRDCHEIEGCPHLFIDAFSGSHLQKTSNSSNTFILTHYHGDHYRSLPRENKYQGPALIHCTTVTAALLLHVHQVPARFIKEHEYGETWEMSDAGAKVTFYDANHCPGAAIVLLELPNGNHHLHCGDMRYSPAMKEYSLLKQAVERKKLDLVYLDTTYGHPKHDFCPQAEAIEKISSVVEQITKENDSTLILLSCYSIGKEKVLWECSERSHQPIFVSAKKYKMLECCQERLDLCTLDATATDIHVIPMGLAGELWPFFQPNYSACRDYAEAFTHKRYSKVVAFLPTGWAASSNWNKKNAIVSKSMRFKERCNETIQVEIRLISYSEHSAFTELIDFVSFLRPCKVVPTVYSDDKDRHKIVSHFRHLVDTTRAKQKFLESMRTSSVQSKTSQNCENTKKSNRASDHAEDGSQLAEPFEPVEPAFKRSKSIDDESAKVLQLQAMGFHATASHDALIQCQGSVEAALEVLLTGVLPT